MSIDKSDFTVFSIAFILLLICFAIRFIINKRRFNRRGQGGLHHFKNYERAWLITLVEKTIMVLTTLIILIVIIIIVMVAVF